MSLVPWMTSDALVEAIKRKIAVPISQNTFSDTDLRSFLNEEMAISQVPQVLQYHEEYYTTTKTVPLVTGTTRYPIPDRAIGMRLRGLFWVDDEGNYYEMTRVSQDDRAFFQSNTVSTSNLHKFFLENNDVVLVPTLTGTLSGSLLFVYFLRPNQLVANSSAAICTGFSQTITLSNASLVAGNTVTVGGVTFTAKTSGASSLEFNIGATSILSATALVSAINTNATYTVSNSSGTSATITVPYTDLTTTFSTSNSSAFVIPSTTTGVTFSSIPATIVAGSVIDFLQTKPGHKIRGFDVTIPTGGVATTTITFNTSDIPTDFIVGDYICLANECIIPQLPTDLHTGLAEKACARILASLGDMEGLQATQAKLQEISGAQNNLLDNRTEGNPQKVLPRHSLLHYGKVRIRRRI